MTFPISYVTEQYANSRLANKKARSSDTRSTNHQPASGDEASAISSGDKGGEGEEENGVAKYERMILNDRPYLCAIPTARAEQASNATAPTSSPDDEKQELIRATDRGWELLQAMQGSCIYYVSGWWSYSFCYNNEVKQFHQLPPSRMVPVYPPQEDPSVQSYVLGSYPSKKDGSWEEGDKKSAVELAKLETKGENRYLVQKIAGGTLCDLTDKERRIEIQVITGLWQGLDWGLPFFAVT